MFAYTRGTARKVTAGLIGFIGLEHAAAGVANMVILSKLDGNLNIFERAYLTAYQAASAPADMLLTQAYHGINVVSSILH